MELLQNVICGEYFDDERYRFIQHTGLTMWEIQLKGRGQMNAYFA